MPKAKWTSKVPSKEGWYWCRYKGKKGLIICPCGVCVMDIGTVIRTARNDTFYLHKPEPYTYYLLEIKYCKLKFGPKIEEP